jgi:hypothetical protein
MWRTYSNPDPQEVHINEVLIDFMLGRQIVLSVIDKYNHPDLTQEWSSSQAKCPILAYSNLARIGHLACEDEEWYDKCQSDTLR